MSTVERPIETVSAFGRVGYWVSLLAALVGLALSVELTKLHLALERDPLYESYCNVSATVNCDAVAKSSYSVLFGLPLSVWGVFAYTAAAVLALWGLRTRRSAPAALLLVLGGVASLGAVALAFISAFVIGSWCLLCAASWGVDAALFVTSLIMVRKRSFSRCWNDVTSYLKSNGVTAVVTAIAAVLALGLTARMLPQKGAVAAPPVPLGASSAGTKKAPATGVTDSGHPFIGAAKPKVLIEEFSDYQCPFCAKAHTALRALVSRYPDEIQVVHRHFPLDNDCNSAIGRPFHTHACYYAKLAVCAGTLARFWQANDFLFHHGHDESPVAVETLARELGVKGDELRQCLSTRATELLKPDIDEGIRLKIDGTPTFIVNGEKVTGPLPEWLLKQYPL